MDPDEFHLLSTMYGGEKLLHFFMDHIIRKARYSVSGSWGFKKYQFPLTAPLRVKLERGERWRNINQSG